MQIQFFFTQFVYGKSIFTLITLKECGHMSTAFLSAEIFFRPISFCVAVTYNSVGFVRRGVLHSSWSLLAADFFCLAL